MTYVVVFYYLCCTYLSYFAQRCRRPCAFLGSAARALEGCLNCLAHSEATVFLVVFGFADSIMGSFAGAGSPLRFVKALLVHT